MPMKLSTLCCSVAQCTFAPGAQNSQPTSYDGAVSTLAAGSTPEQVRQAAQLLATGGLVAFPTETVYGLGADAS
jgi:tRNA A37 threonylcarbamoyladenosine synthetase subunit TsaC/SUA5/YrdC